MGKIMSKSFTGRWRKTGTLHDSLHKPLLLYTTHLVCWSQFYCGFFDLVCKPKKFVPAFGSSGLSSLELIESYKATTLPISFIPTNPLIEDRLNFINSQHLEACFYLWILLWARHLFWVTFLRVPVHGTTITRVWTKSGDILRFEIFSPSCYSDEHFVASP